MKHFRLILLAVAGLLLSACSGDPPETFPDPDAEPTVSRHTVPVEQALGELEDLLGLIDGEGTRAGGVRSVKGVQTLHARALLQTRSAFAEGEQPEDLLYVVNFEQGQGYAVLGADDRLPAVLAVADAGSLSTEELLRAADGRTSPEEFTYPNELLMNYVSGLGGLNGGIGGIGSGGGGIGGGGGIPTGPITDFDKQLGNPDPFFSHYEETEWELLKKIPAMLSTTWNQKNPYNCFCPLTGTYQWDSDGCTIENRCVAGCLPIACAQIIAYHSKVNAPPSIGNIPINWNMIHNAMRFPYLPEIVHNSTPSATAAVGILIRALALNELPYARLYSRIQHPRRSRMGFRQYFAAAQRQVICQYLRGQESSGAKTTLFRPLQFRLG